jgi:hypothetical protein
MHRRGLLNIDNRAIRNFKIVEERRQDSCTVFVVMDLSGNEIERIDAGDRPGAERKLRDAGYERVPSYVAFEIDQAFSDVSEQ